MKNYLNRRRPVRRIPPRSLPIDDDDDVMRLTTGP